MSFQISYRVGPRPGLARRLRPVGQRSRKRLQLLGTLLLSTVAAACDMTIDLNGDGANPSPDGTFTSPECESNVAAVQRPNEGSWTSVVLNDVMQDGENYVCGNGDPYRFYVQFNTGATDLTVALEPGGACWDHESCRGNAGVLNPVRLHAPPADLMTNPYETEAEPVARPWAAMYPHFGRIDNSVPTNKYNHVFFPYCTGDAYTGKVTNEYIGPEGQSLTVAHHGRRNLEAASQWLAATFPAGSTGQLLVVGSSAGAVGVTTNYPLLRDTVAPKCGAMVTDAGPIFPPKGGRFGGLYPPYDASPQQGLLDLVGDRWNLKDDRTVSSQLVNTPGYGSYRLVTDYGNGIVQQLDDRFGNRSYRLVRDYFGHVNRGLSRAFPDDRFLLTTFKQDLNFSVFSFVANGPIAPGDDIADEVLEMWQSEVDGFKSWIDTDSSQNWGYYLPNFRPDFCSHMAATTPLSMVHDTYGYALAGLRGRADGYSRTEIGDMDLGDAIRQLLDRSQPLPPRVDASFDPSQLSFQSEPGATADGVWYDLFSEQRIEDKQAYVVSERTRCVFTNGYPRLN